MRGQGRGYLRAELLCGIARLRIVVWLDKGEARVIARLRSVVWSALHASYTPCLTCLLVIIVAGVGSPLLFSPYCHCGWGRVIPSYVPYIFPCCHCGRGV